MAFRDLRRWSLAPLFGAALLLLSTAAGCGPPTSDDDDSRCDSDEEYTTYKGLTACRTKCVTADDCKQANRVCTRGVCVRSSTPNDADSGMDTGVPQGDTGRCSPDARFTIYRGVKKCRPYCEKNDDCAGPLECEDRHCVDKTLSHPDAGELDARDTVDTSDAEMDTGLDVSPGSLTCQQILQCQRTCSTQSCVDQMTAEGTRQGERNFKLYRNCVQNNCPNSQQSCIDQNCSQKETACFPKVSGMNLSCSEFFLCLNGCPQGDTTCERNCQNRMSTQAMTQYQAIAQCIRRQCPGGSSQCQRQAIAGSCSRSWSTCFNCP